MMQETNTLTSYLPVGFILLILGMLWIRKRYQTPKFIGPRAVVVEFPIPEYKGPFAFFRRHYNGDYSLARSYWVNTLLTSILATMLAMLLLPLLGDVPARHGSAAFLLISAFSMAVWIWGVKGTWSSANKHVQRGGQSGWAMTAKATILLGLVRTVLSLVDMAPALKEHIQVAAGTQLGPQTRFEVRTDGRSILLSGGINDGSAEQLEEALDAAPSVKTVVLSSQGGWIREGRRLAEVIRKRKLNTYVEGYCASACTIAFLAGVERAADPMAKVGFHASRKIGGAREKDAGQLRVIYQQAGLPESFIRQALDTPHESMWHPSHDELLSAHVLTRRTMGGETAAIASSVRSKEALIADLKKTELFAVLAERAPQEFDAIIEAAWDKLKRGAPDSELTLAARAQFTAVLPRYLPLASDETLVAYQKLIQEQLEALRMRSAAACAEMAFPSGKPQQVIAYMPPELGRREVAFATQVLRDGDPARAVTPSAQDLQRVALRAMGDMTPEELAVFADEPTRLRSSPAQICNAAIKFVAGLNAIPESERGAALRTLYASP